MKLTLPQQDVYFEQLLYPNDPIYNIGAKIAIEGNMIYEILNKAYVMLINQHDAYRSIVIENQEEIQIEILSNHNSSLGFVDFSKEVNADKKANIYMQETFKQPFNLKAKELLHRFTLIKISESHYYLFSMYHHIITDGWGTSLMFQRLVANYNELTRFGGIKTEYPYSYKHFVLDDETYFNSDSFIKDKAYWIEKYQNLPERLFEKIKETGPINKSSRKELIIKRSLYNQLSSIATNCNSSTFHIILGVLYLYFGRKCQNDDFAIGLPVLNRSKSVFKKTVGLFMGVSALRINLDFEDTFEKLIYTIKQQLRQDYRYQRFPLGKLIKELDLFREKDRLFNITLSYEKQNYADHFENTKTSVIPLTHQSERVALAVYIREFDDQEDVKIDFDYNVNYFEESEITQVVSHFEKLISNVCADSKKKLIEYQYITKPEQALLLNSFNQTHFEYQKEATLLDFFNKQVKVKSDKTAVKDDSTSYSYKELDIVSNKIAEYLCQNFDNKDTSPIAVLMDRSANLIAILLGIFKSGRAYIPLDPGFPQERLNYIIEHSEVECIIGETKFSKLITPKAQFVDVNSVLYSNSEITLKNGSNINSTDNAYIIYTSGSTGNPKGVAIKHQSLLNFLLSIQQKPKVNSNDLLFSVTTQSFDISILEFFTPLISGATLYIADTNTLTDPIALIEKLEQIQPTILQATPSFYQMLYNIGWSGDLKLKVLCGGDLLSESLAEKLVNTCAEVWNMYGPTETTIWSSCKQIKTSKNASNIGKPIHNTKFYILDKYKKLLPVGTDGTIYIAGDGLAKEYFRDKKLTSDKFIENPFEEGQKMYDTGDIGKWNREGEIEFMGRNDNQVKIRGYRIELGEIETKLNQLNYIKNSVVIAKKGDQQEAVLIAYIILNETSVDPKGIINKLRKELPEYMIPHTIIPLEKFPLTPNKKIDRKSLSLRKIEIEQKQQQVPNQIPTTDLEIKLSKYYQEVLGLEKPISVTESFFELGGHSLNAVKLISRIEEYLSYRISLRTIFDFPTIKSLSKYLENEKKQNYSSIQLVEKKSFYNVLSSQYSIWLASQEKKRSIAYNMSEAFIIDGDIEESLLEKAFQKVVEKYEILRTNFIEINGTPYQRVNLGNAISFKIDKFLIENDIQQRLEDYMNQEFDLENQLLLRVGVFQKTNGDKILIFITHHIIMDGWSLEILIKEVIDSYVALSVKTNPEKQVLGFEFKDYVDWQEKTKKKNEKVNYQFWQQYLSGYEWKNLIQFDQDPLIEKYRAAFRDFNLETKIFEKLNQITIKQKITLHTLLVSVFNVLVYKIQGHKDICLATINSGRQFPDLHSQIGMFAKTLPLRSKINPNQLFSEYLENVQLDLLSLDTYQDIPDNINNNLRLDVLLVLQNPTFSYNQIYVNENLSLKSCSIDSKYSRLPLLINFSVQKQELEGRIQYDIDKYDKETIEILVLKYIKIIEQIIDSIEIPIEDIDTDLEFEKEKTIEIDFSF
ncbi:non-ribosomal peptide synthetase [Aquimarina muelleri]|nr:non-ribosomal peptide synthetase [Aquimarina muelleri]MCX2762218.1 non-ribosomal peptide synthetase [Aquimarina muelleri]